MSEYLTPEQEAELDGIECEPITDAEVQRLVNIATGKVLLLALLEVHKQLLGCWIEDGAAYWQLSLVDTLRWRPNTEPADVPWSNGGFDIVTEHEGMGQHSLMLRDPQNMQELETALRVLGIRE